MKRKNKNNPGYLLPKPYEKLIYGVILNRMRKVLTIRQEYVIQN